MHPSCTTKESNMQETSAGSMLLTSNPLRSGCEKQEKKLIRQGSVSENFFAVKHAALILPKRSNYGEPVEGMKSMVFGGDLKTHLYAIIDILRPQDKIKLVARLESWDVSRTRYIVILSTVGRQDTEESIIVGIDFAKDEHEKCTIGLVIPIWSDTAIKLDGDGGFNVTAKERDYIFKPISVQALWSAYQSIHHCISSAQKNNYYYGSLYLTWTCYYESRILSPRLFINEWEYMDDVHSRPRYYFVEVDVSRQSIEMKIRESLKEVMMKMDLDNCNSRDIRQALEKQTDLDLKEFKEYIDTEMMVILGQMDNASKILDYLYLGSAWNASNWDELTENGVTHILNITKEVENFFPDKFVYKNIRFHDEPTTDLLCFWNDTWKFIRKAWKSNGKCLVHCKMGISRSASTVTAFIMKENHWSMDKSLAFVRDKRPIVLPNKGFMLQLCEYEGILNASSQRHNFIFRSLSESNLSSDHGNADEESKGVQGVDTQVPGSPDDFNRKLLELTLLPKCFSKPCHRRSKSWSVGDGRSYSSDDSAAHDYKEELSLPTGHLSEPQDFTNLSVLTCAERSVTKESRLAEKRRRWRRRHTERIITSWEVDLDIKPQSEDSVFVNPGSSKTSEYWLVETLKGSLTSRTSLQQPIYSGSEEANQVSLKDAKVPVHSSLASPMNSPSFKSTENVNVSALKSHFNDESTLKVDVTDDSSPLVLQSERSVEYRNSSIPADIAEIGCTKTTSPHSPCYGRSLSDSQVCKVKDIVSNIESRCSGELFSELERREAIMEGIEGLNGEMCWRRDGSSDACQVSRYEASHCPQMEQAYSLSDISIIGKNVNQNNNNCIGYDPTEESNVFASKSADQEEVIALDSSLAKDERTRSLTQRELRVIREVGKTFLGETDSSDAALLSQQDGAHTSSSSKSTGGKPALIKKRGIVRRMARMIEARIKMQLGEKEVVEASSKCSLTPVNEKNSRKMSTAQASGGVETIFPVVDITSYSSTQDASAIKDWKSQRLSSSSQMSDIISLIAPTPYSPVGALIFGQAPTRKLRMNIRHSVRRSQSERSFEHQSRRCQFAKRSSALCEAALSEDCFSMRETHSQAVGVKNTVKMFEKQKDVSESPAITIPRISLADSDVAMKKNEQLPIDVPSFRLDASSKNETSSDRNNFSARGSYCWMSRNNCLYQTI